MSGGLPNSTHRVYLPCLIIRLIIQTIRQDRSGSDQIDEASNVSRPDRSGADQVQRRAPGYGSGGWGFQIPRAAPKMQLRARSRSPVGALSVNC